MAVKLPDTLVPMADFPSAFARDVQFTDGENLQDKLDKGKLGSSSSGTGLTEEQANNIEKIPSIEGTVTSNSQAIANKADKNHKHTEYLTKIPDEYITETELEAKGYLTEHQSLTDYAKKTDIPDVSDFLTEVPEGYVTDAKLSTELNKKVNKEAGKGLSTNDLTNELVTKINSSATEAFVTNAIANAQLGSGEVDLSGYATIDALNLKADLTHTHDQYLTEVPDEYITETELTNKNYADKAYVTQAVKNVKVDLTGYAKTSDIPTKVSQLTNDKRYLSSVPSEYVTETELNSKGYLTEHQDISNLALKSEIPDVSSFITSDDLPTVPTKVSELTNDKNYISSIPSEYVTETELAAKKYLTSVPSTYAKKTDIPTVPTKTSQLTNDSGFITSIPAEYITETELNAKGYLTSHQDISGLQTKTDNNLATTSKKVVGAINELKSIINTLQNKITALENQQSATVKVTGVTLSTNTLSMKVGGTTTLTANIRPSNATNKNVTWSTNNSSIASVSNGVVTAKAKGQATITVTTADGDYTDTCIVTVSETVTTISVTGVTLSSHALTMDKIGGTQTLRYTITPSNATNKNVTWSTSVPTVASVNNGLVTANANGTTVITIRTTDGGHTDTCTVTVNDTSQSGGGGDDTLYTPDIASYGISKDGTNSEATTNGLNRLFADLNTNKKTNVQLPTGTYAINPDISLTPKSNLTLDLNNSKLKIDANNKNGSTMIYLKEVENLTLKNGTIEGDRYDHDYATYNENTTSHEFNVGLKIDQGSRNINIDNVKFTKITGYGLATFQGTQYCNAALDKTIMESGDYNDSGSKVADATKIRYPQAVNITEHATHGYLQVGTLLKYQNYVFNSTRTVTVRMFDASGSLLSKVTSKMYRPIAVPSNATTAYLTFHQSDPADYLDGDMYTLDVFHMKPPRDCNITNCTFDDNRCLGIAVCGGWNIKIEGNTFKNTSKPTSDKTSPNYQHGKPGYAIDIEDGWESTQDLTINDNVFTNNGFGDIVSLAGDNTVITNNQFTGRVAMYSRNTNYIVQNNTIANGIAMWETEKDYGFTVDHNTYTDTTIKAKCYKPYDDDYYTFTNETITNCQMQLDTSITLKNSTIDLDGTTGSRFTGSYDTCTISDFDGTDANSDYNTGIKLNNCNVSKCNFFPSKDTIMTNNVFNTFRVRLDNGSLVFTGNDIQSNPKNTSMPIVQLNGGTSATIKKNTLGSAVTVDLYTNPANIPVITDDESTGEYRAVTQDDLTTINSTLTIDDNGYKLTANNKWDGVRLTNVPKESKITLFQTNHGQCIWYMYKCDSDYMYVLCIGNGNGEHGKVYKMSISSSSATQNGTISMTMKPREKDILKVVVDGSTQTLYCNDTELCTLTDCNAVGISNQREANNAYIASKWEVLY